VPMDAFKSALRWCVTIRGGAPGQSASARARSAITAGATLLRYKAATSLIADFAELAQICRLCRSSGVVFLIEDDPILARSLDAHGIHWNRPLEALPAARQVLGDNALIGARISLSRPLSATDLAGIDYFSVKPPTGAWRTKGKREAALAGIKALSSRVSPVPLVVDIVPDTALASLCVAAGAAGVVTGAGSGPAAARAREAMAAVLDCQPREYPSLPWQDEFQLIRHLLNGPAGPLPPGHPALLVPPGDDACLLSPLTRPVISSDTQREGVHFRFEWQTPVEIGEKAVSAALSDLAACYARPVGLFINLGLPEWIPEQTIIAVYQGVQAALVRYGAALGGGNISRSREFALDLFAVGEGRPDLFPTRTTARPGFGLYATGPLGLARAGLEALRLKDSGFPLLVDRFKKPAARFDAAQVLANHGVACVMDISDGLAGDAGHLAAASGVSIEIDVGRMELEEEFSAFCRKYDKCPETLIISGGEDYELLFACAPETFERIGRRLPQAIQVGRILTFRGQPLMGEAAAIRSFQHGQKHQPPP
jgi:thiamine-monophosphate kinase